MESIRQEQKDEFVKEVVDLYSEKLYHYTLKLTAHPDDALDVLQNTLLNAWLHYSELRDKNAVWYWLKKICFREFLHWAKQKNIPTENAQSIEKLMEESSFEIADKAPDIEEEILVEEDIKAMQNGCFLAMVRKLTLEQRIAFSMSDMFGMDICGISNLLGINENAAKSLLHRARMNIDSFFSGHCNLLSSENPCSCKAWVQFWENRAKLQEGLKDSRTQMKQLLEKENQLLDYEAKGYQFDETVREKIYTLYRTMPDQKPKDGWYEAVINSFL